MASQLLEVLWRQRESKSLVLDSENNDLSAELYVWREIQMRGEVWSVTIGRQKQGFSACHALTIKGSFG